MNFSSSFLILLLAVFLSSCSTPTQTFTDAEANLKENKHIFDQKDQDFDGVFDQKDECPNTPKDAKVDSKGCVLDSDEDGIADFEDNCPTEGKGFAIDRSGCPRIEKTISKINLNIHFDSKSYVIKVEYADKIKKIAYFMTKYPDSTVIIEGHTDSQSKTMDNTELSLNRALSVKNYLVDVYGINTARIEHIGYGPDKPIATNETYFGRAKNRRVIAIISHKQYSDATPNNN